MKAIKTLFLLAIMGLSLSIASLTAQPLAQKFVVLSPTTSDTVTPGSLLVIIGLPENHNTKAEDYKMMLDGKRDISENLLVRKNMLSVIYSEPMAGGRHSFEFFRVLNDKQKPELLLTYYFQVREPPPELVAQKTVPPKQTTTAKKKPLLTGNIRLSSADADITGPGAMLRQEPPSVREIGADLKVRAGKGEITLKGFYTTNAKGPFGYRNTFNIGYNKNGSSITIGDHFVDQDRFTFNGIRVRGVFLDAFFPNTDQKLKIRFMYGKNVDANYVPNNFPLPPDSSNNIFEGAIPKYERDYYLVQFYVQHSKYAYGKFSFVRVRDYANDELIAGIPPKDNGSASWEKYIPIAENRGYVRLNAALAFTSLNNTLGGEPAFNFLIHLNSSTVPLTFKQAPQCAFGLAMSIPITKANDLIVDAKRIGASYYSLANPYMLNNRYTVHVADNLRLFKNRFFLNLAYDYMIDNLGEQRPQTRENSSVSGSTTIRLSEKFPSLTLGYRYFIANTFSNIQENYNVENTGIFGSLQYTLKLEPMTFQFVLTRNDLNLISEVMANSRQELNGLSFSAIFKNIIGVSFQGSQTTQYLEDLAIPQEYMSVQFWYRIRKPDIRFKILVMTNTMENQEFGKSYRKGVQAGIDFSLKRYLNIGLNAGYLPFTSFTEDRSYTERFIRITCGIRF